MATFPLPGQEPRPSLDPDDVGFIRPGNMAQERAEALSHTPETCTLEHCSCHLPVFWNPDALSLTGREALVLAWHLFPLNDDSDEELSFEEIGKKLGVSPTRTRQIYMRAAAKLRAYPRDHYPPRPGTPEYEAQQAAVEKYREEHPGTTR